MRSKLLVYGDEVASIVATVLRRLPSVMGRFDVEFVDASRCSNATLPDAGVVLEQRVANSTSGPARSAAIRVLFPKLEFQALWPLNAGNPFNEPEPPDLPHGRFPYGDSFLAACAAALVPRKEALALYSSPAWSPSWPNLRDVFEAERLRLADVDDATNVRIGKYILESFRTQRLFVTPICPSNVLLGELIERMLQLCLAGRGSITRREIDAALASLGTRDAFGQLELPVHPLVAEYFRLQWYDPYYRYNYFDRVQLNTREYFERFYDAMLVKAHETLAARAKRLPSA